MDCKCATYYDMNKKCSYLCFELNAMSILIYSEEFWTVTNNSDTIISKEQVVIENCMTELIKLCKNLKELYNVLRSISRDNNFLFKGQNNTYRLRLSDSYMFISRLKSVIDELKSSQNNLTIQPNELINFLKREPNIDANR